MIDNITTVHAVKYALVAGVTGILNVLAKPVLIRWGENTCLEAAVDGGSSSLAAKFLAGSISEEALKSFQEQCRGRRDQIVKAKASGGTKIHDILEKFAKGDNSLANNPYVLKARNVMASIEARFPGQKVVWEAEKSFFNPLGFGGRTDLLGRVDGKLVAVIDWKTREFEEADVAKAEQGRAKGNRTFGNLTPRETEPIQIAANIKGHGGDLATVIGGNLYLSRTQSSRAFYHEYSASELETNWETFKALLVVFLNIRVNK